MNQFHLLIEELQQPEYLHVLINPLPVYGLFLGLASLALALALRSRAAQVTGLALILVSAASVWPVYVAGHKAYNKVYLIVDDEGKAWLDAHMRRGEKTVCLFAALAALALTAIVLPLKIPKTARPAGSAYPDLRHGHPGIAGRWIASGRRQSPSPPEFRNVPSPKNPSGDTPKNH